MSIKQLLTTAHVEIRAQHSRGSTAYHFGGPDTYVAVQIVPADECRLRVLNHKHAENHGIKIKYFGEGYSRNQATERSMLGAAIASAEKFVRRFENLRDQEFNRQVHEGVCE